jgi:hypothetical protein
MRPPCSTRPIIFGFILVIGITLTLPYLAFGASGSFGASGRFRAPGFDWQDFFSHRFDRFGFVGGVSGFSEVIIIQQSQPAPNIEPSETNASFL